MLSPARAQSYEDDLAHMDVLWERIAPRINQATDDSILTAIAEYVDARCTDDAECIYHCYRGMIMHLEHPFSGRLLVKVTAAGIEAIEPLGQKNLLAQLHWDQQRFYSAIGDGTQSAFHTEQAIALFREVGNTRMLLKGRFNKLESLFAQSNSEEVFEEWWSLLDTAEVAQDTFNYYGFWDRLTWMTLNMKRYDLLAELYERASTPPFPPGPGRAENFRRVHVFAKGVLDLQAKRYSDAITHFHDYRTSVMSENDTWRASYAWLYIAGAEQERGRERAALAGLDSALILADAIGPTSLQISVHNMRLGIAEDNHDFEAALAHLRARHQAETDWDETQMLNETVLFDLQVERDALKKQNDSAALELSLKAQELLEVQNQTQRERFNRQILTFFLIGVVAVLLFAFYYLRTTRRAAAEIAARKQELEVTLSEKEVLLKEIHHRVKNNMQVVSGLLELQAHEAEDEEVSRLVNEGKSRIETMALIHQMLYSSSNLSTISFGDYIEKLAHQIASAYALGGEVDVQLNIAPVQLDLDDCVTLGLITHELLNNALKYAFPDEPGVVTIALNQDQGRFEFTVGDNGVGLPDGVDPMQVDSLGLRLVRMLATDLRATVNYTNNPGVTCTLRWNQEDLTS